MFTRGLLDIVDINQSHKNNGQAELLELVLINPPAINTITSYFDPKTGHIDHKKCAIHFVGPKGDVIEHVISRPQNEIMFELTRKLESHEQPYLDLAYYHPHASEFKAVRPLAYAWRKMLGKNKRAKPQ